MADMNDVIERLIERTGEHRVPWKGTIDDDAFSATIGGMSAMVKAQMIRRSRLEPSAEPLSLSIAVFDEKWNEIASFDVSRHSPRDYQKMLSLWQAAKMSATGAYPKLDAFLEVLDAAPPVSPPEPDRRRPTQRS